MLRYLIVIAPILNLFIGSACASQSTNSEPGKAHHTASGFVNSNGTSGDGKKNFLVTMFRFAEF